MDGATKHLAAAEHLRQTAAPAGPRFALAYDAAHRGMRALLAQQGLRPTTRGGDRAIAEAVTAQFGEGFGRFDALRRRHDQIEFPKNPVTATVSASEADRALTRARELVDEAARLIDELSQFSKKRAYRCWCPHTRASRHPGERSEVHICAGYRHDLSPPAPRWFWEYSEGAKPGRERFDRAVVTLVESGDAVGLVAIGEDNPRPLRPSRGVTTRT